MVTDTSILIETSFLGFTAYGMGLLFLKAIVILVTAQLLAEQLEFSPATVRHTIWLLALAALAVLPSLTNLVPEWPLLLVSLPDSLPNINMLDSEPVSTGLYFSDLSWLDVLVLIYLGVAAVRLLLLCVALGRVGWLTAYSTPAAPEWYDLLQPSTSRAVRIRMSHSVPGPMTWGSLYPVILLPQSVEQWSSQDKSMVIRHEWGHIARFDWLTQLLAHLVAILYWPVPGVRRALTQLSLEAERACDNVVLEAGSSPAEYASMLLQQSRNTRLPATVALGSTSELVQRVRHIVSAYVDRARERRLQWILVTIAAALMVPLAAVKATGQLAGEKAPASLRSVAVVSSIVPVASVQETVVEQRPVRPVRPSLHSLSSTPAVYDLPQLPADYQVDVVGVDQPVLQPEVAVLQADDISAPRILAQRAPTYPSAAQRRGIEGDVLVEFDITTEGLVANPRVIDSQPGRVFEQTVLSALQAYRFEPPRIGGRAVPLSSLRKQFRFRLSRDTSPVSTPARMPVTAPATSAGAPPQSATGPPFDSG